MKNKALIITLFIFSLAIMVNAQEKKELKVKILKSENGETITIDTTLNSEDGHVYFYSDGEVNQEKVDSMLKSLGIENHPTIDFISSKLDDNNTEHVKQIWITKDGDVDENVTIRMDGDAKVIETTKAFTIIKNDDSEDSKSEYIIYSGDDVVYDTDEKGKKVIVSKSSSSESYTWNITELKEANVIVLNHDITIDTDAKADVKIIGDEDDDVQISEIVIKKGEGDCKTIEVFVDGDEFNGDEKMVELEEILEGKGEKVKIIKYKTGEGKFVVKAEIMDCELSEDEQQKANEIGLKDESKLELEKFKLYPNPTEGLFTIEFEIKSKANTVLKVYNEEGKSVYSGKIKKSEGLYSKQIDISKEDKGIYFIRIIQGDKSVTKKVLKK